MDPLEQASNADLLTTLAGKVPADRLLQKFGSLTGIAKASLGELREVKGVGPRKAKSIKSAFLLAQRLSLESYADAPLLDTPEKVADLLREQNRLYPVEHFQIALLNTRRRLIEVQDVTQGTLDTLLVHPREVFSRAISRRASAIILVHNHPSGDPSPSTADIKITRELVRAGELLKIEVLDHVILGHRTESRPRDFVSLRELGCIYG